MGYVRSQLKVDPRNVLFLVDTIPAKRVLTQKEVANVMGLPISQVDDICKAGFGPRLHPKKTPSKYCSSADLLTWVRSVYKGDPKKKTWE